MRMDSELETPSIVDAQAQEGPSPWIPLGPAHLLFWAVLIWPVVLGLVHRFLFPLFPGIAAEPIAWILTAGFWALGGCAIALGFKAQQAENPGGLRWGAFLTALVIWILQAAIGLALRFQHVQYGGAWYAFLRIEPWVAPIFAAVPLILMMASREEQSGGTFDASIAALAMLGGLGFLGPLLLAFGALIGGHPLLAVAWEALTRPGEALKGEWFDGGDEASKGRCYGRMALAFALGMPFLVVLMIVAGRFGRGGFDLSTQWIRPFAAWLTTLPLGLAALRTMRRSGVREGRGMAVAALVVFGLELLPVLLAVVLLVLWSAHIIR